MVLAKGVGLCPGSADAVRWEPPKSAVTGHPVPPRARGAVGSESRAKVVMSGWHAARIYTVDLTLFCLEANISLTDLY